MISPQFHANRRTLLMEMNRHPILLLGNGHRKRNLPMNHLPFRQDSTFLYYFGYSLPNAAALLIDGEVTIFIPFPHPSDALWHGPMPSVDDIRQQLGVHDIRPIEELATACKSLQGSLQTIAIPDEQRNQLASRLTGVDLCYGKANGSSGLIENIIQMRRQLQAEEIEEMQKSAAVSTQAHLAAMANTHVGGHEQEVAAAFHYAVQRNGYSTAYQSIVTVDGHILHNHHYRNSLQDGQLLLLDGGAEAPSGYASDVTRTWPVNGTFTSQQAAAYEAVLASQLAAIDMVRPGVRYRDVHLCAAKILAQFLCDEGLLTCSPEQAVEVGAHALFFPHGVGHLIGLDVHDLENFGDQAAYPPHRQRSSQFGLGYLRLDLDLQPGMAVTIEPGFYISPSILQSDIAKNLSSYVGWKELAKWQNFGGIRIEDDVVVTQDAPLVLSKNIPKTIADIQSAVGCAVA